MFKLMNFSGDDIRLDEKAVSSRISQCCSVAGMRVEGVAAINDILTVICSDNDPAADMEYIYQASVPPKFLDVNLKAFEMGYNI